MKYCTNCGSKLNENAAVCLKCGVGVNGASTHQSVQINMGGDVANGKVSVNKLVYCILAFFLGGIGIHKFYAGRIGSGVLYLIFFWTFIPSIIAFIEFIIGICKQPDQNGNILV